MVVSHKGEEFEKVKWGMFIKKFLRSSFERQIEEAVQIERIAKSGEILNSRSEYNNCTLPRLVTRIGDSNEEFKKLEKEQKELKEIDDKIEAEIRSLRRERNKTRLITEKGQPPKKRMKIEDRDYISIRETWGPPKTTAPQKNKKNREHGEEKEIDNPKKRRIEEGERISNLRTIENRVIEGEQISEFEIEIVDKVDWENRLKEHKERLEKETREREEQIKRSKIKEKSWELYRECRNFLEHNEKNWEKNRADREQERKKLERLEIARMKQENLRHKVKERKLKEKIETGMEKLPEKERTKILREEEREQRLEMIEAKKAVWKLRKKQKKVVKKPEKVERLEKIEKMEEKLITIEEILRELREEKERKMKNEEERKEKQTKEWRKKLNIRDRKEREMKERAEKERIIEENWELLKWSTGYISENMEQWREESRLQEMEARRELEEWDKLKRKEKIEKLKLRWRKNELPEKREKKGEVLQEMRTITNIEAEFSYTALVEMNTNSSVGTKLQNTSLEVEHEKIEGGSLVAFPFQKNKAPSMYIQEGDPPIGKERGTLGVGTGPTPPPKKLLNQGAKTPQKFHS